MFFPGRANMYADYTVDGDKVRSKFSELLNDHELYDEESEPTVQVVGSDKEANKIRCLCSARDAASAWQLHCDLREAMIAYLAQLSDGGRLARERVQVIELVIARPVRNLPCFSATYKGPV